MKFLKKYTQFMESLQIDLSYQVVDLVESLSVWHDTILSSVGAELVDIFDIFKLPKQEFKDNLDIEYLSDNIDFINSLASIGLKKSPVEDTDSYECFVNKPCRFMMIFDFNSNELENPEYMLFQCWNQTINKWDECKLYKIKDDIKKFYDKLSSKTIEIVDGGENYIYTTSNNNDWILQNRDKETDDYKKSLRKEELQKLLDEKSIKLNII